MLNAREVMNEFFDCLRNLSTSVDRCADLFTEDGVFELPYFPSIGLNPRFEGREAVRGAFELIRSHFSSFTLSNIQIHELKDDSGLFAEYHSDGFIDGTERIYAQDYASRLIVENGKIKLFARISEYHFHCADATSQWSRRRAGANPLNKLERTYHAHCSH